MQLESETETDVEECEGHSITMAAEESPGFDEEKSIPMTVEPNPFFDYEDIAMVAEESQAAVFEDRVSFNSINSMF